MVELLQDEADRLLAAPLVTPSSRAAGGHRRSGIQHRQASRHERLHTKPATRPLSPAEARGRNPRRPRERAPRRSVVSVPSYEAVESSTSPPVALSGARSIPPRVRWCTRPIMSRVILRDGRTAPNWNGSSLVHSFQFPTSSSAKAYAAKYKSPDSLRTGVAQARRATRGGRRPTRTAS